MPRCLCQVVIWGIFMIKHGSGRLVGFGYLESDFSLASRGYSGHYRE